MNELWKDIEGYEGLYQISNLGRVKSLSRIWEAGIKGVYRTKLDTIRKLQITKKGYAQIILKHPDNKSKGYAVHRLVAKAFIPNLKSFPQVNHIDCNKLNNHVSNLEWCTNDFNIKHANKNGLHGKGELHARSKWKESDVLLFRKLHSEGVKMVDISKKYGINSGTLFSIIHRTNWKHI
jgi:hypothetical protein